MPVYRDDEQKTWFYVFNFYDDYGKRKQKRKRGFKTKKDATDALRKLEVQFSDGTYVESKNIPFKQYIKDWFSIKKLSLSNNTISLYVGSIKNNILPVLGNIELSKLKPMHIRNSF